MKSFKVSFVLVLLMVIAACGGGDDPRRVKNGHPLISSTVMEGSFVFHSGPSPVEGTNMGFVTLERTTDHALFSVLVGLPYEGPEKGTPMKVLEIIYTKWELSQGTELDFKAYILSSP